MRLCKGPSKDKKNCCLLLCRPS